jgi:rubredoxin
MFTICPDCGNDKLKVKVMDKRLYDPQTTRTIVNEEISMVEYHCNHCGWVALLEDPPFDPREMERLRQEQQAEERLSRL